jgi:hypothetical protein
MYSDLTLAKASTASEDAVTSLLNSPIRDPTRGDSEEISDSRE